MLYYPTIEFLDETWLRASLCLWDKIYRIVPSSYNPQDSDEVKKAIDHGLVENINLNRSDLEQTAEYFEKYINNLPMIPAGIEGYDNYDNIDVRLHPEKVDARILPILEGLAKKIDQKGFLHLNNEIANTYMLFLSDIVSKRRNINKLTDNGDMFAIMHYFANDANFNEWIYSQEATEVTTSLVISSLLPKGLEHTNIDYVINFRNRTHESRKSIKNSIDKLVAEICLIEDKDFAKEQIRGYLDEIERNKLSLIKQAGKVLSDFKYSLISVGFPTSISAYGLIGNCKNAFDLTRVGSSCFIGAVSALADSARTKRKNWKQSDSFYYHQLDKIFGSEKEFKFTIPNFHGIFEEFIND